MRDRSEGSGPDGAVVTASIGTAEPRSHSRDGTCQDSVGPVVRRSR